MAVWFDEIDLVDIWNEYRVKDLDDPDVFMSYRDAVVKVLRTSEWAEDYFFPLEFSITFNINQFNSVLNDMYDCADIDRVWIKTS